MNFKSETNCGIINENIRLICFILKFLTASGDAELCGDLVKHLGKGMGQALPFQLRGSMLQAGVGVGVEVGCWVGCRKSRVSHLSQDVRVSAVSEAVSNVFNRSPKNDVKMHRILSTYHVLA